MSTRIEKLRSLIKVHRDVPTIPFIAAGAALLVLGLIGVARVIFHGHEAVYGVTRQVPWGLLIATYAYFVITSTGLAFIGGLGHAFGFNQFARLSKRIVLLAFIFLLAGFTQIGMELGHPFRLMYLFIISPHFSAPIVWMGLFYGIELGILALEMLVIFNPNGANHNLAAFLGFLALLVGVAATSNLGYVFGSLTARPFFHGIYFPAFLVVSGIGGGAALLLVIYNIVHRLDIPAQLNDAMGSLGKLLGTCIAVMIFLYFWKIMSSLYTEPMDAFDSVRALLHGPLSANFWIGEIMMALLLPLMLIIAGTVKNSRTMGFAGIFFLIGMFFTRYDFIVAGQLPTMRSGAGSGVQVVNGLAQYVPSSGEWMIFALGLGVFLFLYFLSERFLNLETEAH